MAPRIVAGKLVDVQALEDTNGFLVADAQGRLVGHVEGLMYGTAPDKADAVAVRSGLLVRHHFVVPAELINEIDERTAVVGLLVDKRELQRFL